MKNLAALSVCLNCGKVNRVNLGGPLGLIPICGSCRGQLPLRDALNVIEPRQLRAAVERVSVPIAAFFWKPFDGPSEMLKGVLNEVSEGLAGRILFVSVNAENHSSVTELFRLDQIPTIILFENKKELARQSGHMFSDTLMNWLGSIFGF